VRVFDLGGNVGNLFYAYQRKIKFLRRFFGRCMICPSKSHSAKNSLLTALNATFAYASTLAEASGSDVFIASGSSIISKSLCT